MAIESLALYNQKQLGRSLNDSLQGGIFIAPEKEEQFFEEQDLGLAKTDKEVNSVSLAVNGDDGLRNEGDFASPSAPSGIEDSSTEIGHANNQNFSTKRQRLNPGLLDGAVVKNGETLHDPGVNPDQPLQDSETNMVETKNLGLNFDQHGTQTMLTKEELDERNERRKMSNRESAKRSRLRKQQENEMFRKMAKKLKWEISELTDGLSSISEQCQEITEENDSLKNEVEEKYGPDAISDLRARNPAFANHDKGDSSHDSDSTADHSRDTSTNLSD